MSIFAVDIPLNHLIGLHTATLVPHHQRTADIMCRGVWCIAEYRTIFRKRLHAIFAEEVSFLLIITAYRHTAMAHTVEMAVAIDAITAAASDREG